MKAYTKRIPDMIDDAGASLLPYAASQRELMTQLQVQGQATQPHTTVKAVCNWIQGVPDRLGEIIKRDDRLFFVAAKIYQPRKIQTS